LEVIEEKMNEWSENEFLLATGQLGTYSLKPKNTPEG